MTPDLANSVGLVLASLLGVLLGSFLNACIYRMPREISIADGRSKCPRCKRLIPWYWNIPIVSYIWLGGKCGKCKKAISIQYPLVEIGNGLLFALVWLKFGLRPEFFFYAAFCASLLTASVIDLHHQILPDEITLGGIPVGILCAVITGYITWKNSLLGALIGGGSFFSIAYLYSFFAKRDGLGGGDVKLLAMLGAWLGVPSLLPIIIFSSALGSVVGVILMLRHGKNLQTAIPFGPFLAASALIYLFLSEWIDPLLLPL